MNEVIEYWFSIVADYVASIFTYQIVDGVYFGYLIMAMIIMGLVVSFLFHRIVK